MTFGPKQVAGVLQAKPVLGFFGTTTPMFGANWGEIKLGFGFTLLDVWTCKYHPM